MWPVVFDKWSEKWVVGEYSRADDGGKFFWRTAAEQSAAQKNLRLHQQPTSSRSEHTEYDTDEAADVWPGSLVSYGSSHG